MTRRAWFDEVPAWAWVVGIVATPALVALLMTTCGRRMTPPVASEAEATSVIVQDLERIGRQYVRFDLGKIEQSLEVGETIGRGDGYEVRRVTLTVNGAKQGGLLGVPTSAALTPVIVVCHPADDPYQTGLHTRSTVEALAAAGYRALSIDYRGWGTSEGSRGGEVADAVAAIRAARTLTGSDGRVGLLGFSMGGGVALRASLVDTDVQAIALFYPQLGGAIDEIAEVRLRGRVPGAGQILALLAFAQQAGANEAEVRLAIRQTSPIYHVARGTAPIAVFHGEADEVVSVLQSRALEAEARRVGREVEAHYIPGARHAFANEWETNVARDALLAFFQRTLPLGGS